MKRALVTGGCGFIGSNLTKRLVIEGWTVDVIDDMSSGRIDLLGDCNIRVIPADLLFSFYDSKTERPDATVHIIQGDFGHPAILSNIVEKKYDIVFHQAAIPRVLFSVENPFVTTDVNVSGTVKLLEACIGNVDRVVFASSSSVYGGADQMPTLETNQKDPKSPYAWQKSAIEDISKIFCSLYDIDIVCLRYFNVFGPGQHGDSAYATAISAWCHAVKNNDILRSDGDGSQSRDLCYVDNVVQANLLAAQSNIVFNGKCYNIACGDRTSNKEILEFFTSRFSNLSVESAPWRAGDVMHTQADVSLAEEDFGYRPIVRFWEGLERTLEWWGLDDGN